MKTQRPREVSLQVKIGCERARVWIQGVSKLLATAQHPPRIISFLTLKCVWVSSTGTQRWPHVGITRGVLNPWMSGSYPRGADVIGLDLGILKSPQVIPMCSQGSTWRWKALVAAYTTPLPVFTSTRCLLNHRISDSNTYRDQAGKVKQFGSKCKKTTEIVCLYRQLALTSVLGGHQVVGAVVNSRARAHLWRSGSIIISYCHLGPVWPDLIFLKRRWKSVFIMGNFPIFKCWQSLLKY